MTVTPEQRLEMIRAAWYIDPEEVEPDLRAAVHDIKFVLAALRKAQAENERLRAKIDYYENGLRTLYVGRPSDAALAPADEATP